MMTKIEWYNVKKSFAQTAMINFQNTMFGNFKQEGVDREQKFALPTSGTGAESLL